MLQIESSTYLDGQLAKLAPVEIACPTDGLSTGDRMALEKLVSAAAVMDELFSKQVCDQNEEIRSRLNDAKEVLNQKALAYFTINFGPFDRLNHHRPFIGRTEKPAGANFYPADMSRVEWERHLKENPGDVADFCSNFTMIRRVHGRLKAIPYSHFFASELKKAASLLREAAELTESPSLKTYLLSRAEAFKSNDYRRSDMDWMDLTDHDLEVVIGPYEVYEDALFGYKAAFEAFVTRVDRVESDRLKRFSSLMDELEENLPIAGCYKNFKRGKGSPIVVANEIYTAGDTKAGVQTTAFNLPNDEYVRQLKGSKKVLLKNIAQAKFEQCWIPIVNRVLGDEELERVSFEAYFSHILQHEIAHGLGPGIIWIEGRETTVSRELKALYPIIEETKADILGFWNLIYLVERGAFAPELKEKLFSTYLGGIFRSVRFGISEAHGGANAIQLNFIEEKGGFVFDEERVRYSVKPERMLEAARELSHEVLMIEARGDSARAQAFVKRYRKIDGRLQRALDKLADIPIDIRPHYPAELLSHTRSVAPVL